MSKSRKIRLSLVPGLAAGLVALGACGDSATELALCEAVVDLFPVPVNSATSPFGDTDDAFLQVDFASGFQFSFYGTQYSSVFLNTNGGMTFGDGDDEFDVAAAEVIDPGIAVFWGDLDGEGSTASETRANQMTYQACADRFVVTYTQFQDHDDDTWNNTGTVTLESNGRIVVAYGTVLSEDILVGVFDGTHTNDQSVAVQNSYSGYSTNGTGTLLFDYNETNVAHTGELNGRTVTYNP